MSNMGDDLAEVPCQSLTSSSGTLFDITRLETDTHYSKSLGSNDELQWNYCGHGDLDDGVFAVREV